MIVGKIGFWRGLEICPYHARPSDEDEREAESRYVCTAIQNSHSLSVQEIIPTQITISQLFGERVDEIHQASIEESRFLAHCPRSVRTSLLFHTR